jgi:hypothetical protein
MLFLRPFQVQGIFFLSSLVPEFKTPGFKALLGFKAKDEKNGP